VIDYIPTHELPPTPKLAMLMKRRVEIQMMSWMPRRSGIAALILVFQLFSPALALGGNSVSESASHMDRHTIMVHGDRGNTCSGTVISPTVVITAAHCVTGSKRYAVSYREGGSPILQEVRDVARHPNFEASANVSVDLALIRMRVPLPSRFVPLALDSASNSADDNSVGSTQTIAGFGLSTEGDEKTMGTLRTAEVTVLPRYYPRFFRLGRNDNAILICRGDSGGPVVRNRLLGTALTGVIYASERASGLGRCGRNAQAIRIAPQRRWIDGVMAKWAN
jgi:secreted trypsin-like serine protease